MRRQSRTFGLFRGLFGFVLDLRFGSGLQLLLLHLQGCELGGLIIEHLHELRLRSCGVCFDTKLIHQYVLGGYAVELNLSSSLRVHLYAVLNSSNNSALGQSLSLVYALFQQILGSRISDVGLRVALLECLVGLLLNCLAADRCSRRTGQSVVLQGVRIAAKFLDDLTGGLLCVKGRPLLCGE